MNGTKAVLSKATNAVRDDVLIKKGGSVVGRMQLKDTPKSIYDTVSKVKDGHYAGTSLVGTTETVKAYEKAVEGGAKITQKMTSSGISSSDTARIATETIGKQAGELTAESLGTLAISSGLAGGAISGGLEVISSGVKLLDGEIDGEEFVGNVVKESIGGGISSMSGGVAATAASAVAATAIAGTTAPIWIPAAVGIGAAVAVGSAVKGIFDSIFD